MKKDLAYWHLRAIAPFKGMLFIAAENKDAAITLLAKAVARPLEYVRGLKIKYVEGWGPSMYGYGQDITTPTVLNRVKIGQDINVVYPKKPL